MLKRPEPKTKSLADRIADFRAELDQFIDAKAAELKQENEGVPVQVLRTILSNRAGACQCQAALNILEQS
jgi:hypothetical protein